MDNNHNQSIINVPIKNEMENSYLAYAMSVIVSRALPDARDGLKPVHRRIFYGMMELDLRANSSFKKCARIVGEVMGKFHPHGNMAIYDALARMAQPWSMRYMLVDGQGNFGSIDGDAPAADRYTEARLKLLSEELLLDIDKETVDFQDNYDGSLQEPVVLPSRFPNLLVNGADGIAVGMATKIPPHNLTEVVNACLMYMDNPYVTVEQLLQVITGPDFPTGAYIVGRKGILDAFRTGRGRIVMRAKTHVEEISKDKEAIIVTEIPYQVNKAAMIEAMANLVRDKKLEGISDLRDESDKRGLRIVIELKRGESPAIVLNQLYKQTALQTSFGVNMVALINNRPETLSLTRALGIYVSHRFDVVTRRTRYELRKAEERAHILQGLKIALDNIDEVIQIIKTSSNSEQARDRLMDRFQFSEIQAKAILAMRLSALTSLETQKILDELAELEQKIAWYKSVLADRSKVFDLIRSELMEIKEKYGDARRTEIIIDPGEISIRDLLANEKKLVTITKEGYLKALPLDTYAKQARGGKGMSGLSMKEEDVVHSLFLAETFDYVVFFTNQGRCFARYAHSLPEGSRTSKGKNIVNFLNLQDKEKVTAVMPLKSSKEGEFDRSDELYITMATREGLIKKSRLSEYHSSTRENGILAIKFATESDEVVAVSLSDNKRELILGTFKGKAIRFPEHKVRSVGRVSQGVGGIRLEDGDYVVGMEILSVESSVKLAAEGPEEVVLASSKQPVFLVVTDKGYGKRTRVDQYRITNRAGKGVLNIRVTPKVGNVVGFMEIEDEDELILISMMGKVIRLKARSIPIYGRATQGVKVIHLTSGDYLVGVSRIAKDMSDGSEIDEIPEQDEEVIEETLLEEDEDSPEPND